MLRLIANYPCSRQWSDTTAYRTYSYWAQTPACHRRHRRTARRVCRTVVLATHTPLIRVRPTPHAATTGVIMLSGCIIGAGVMACAEVPINTAKVATASHFIIVHLPCVKERIPAGKSLRQTCIAQRRNCRRKERECDRQRDATDGRLRLTAYWQTYMMPSVPLTSVPGVQTKPLRARRWPSCHSHRSCASALPIESIEAAHTNAAAIAIRFEPMFASIGC